MRGKTLRRRIQPLPESRVHPYRSLTGRAAVSTHDLRVAIVRPSLNALAVKPEGVGGSGAIGVNTRHARRRRDRLGVVVGTRKLRLSRKHDQIPDLRDRFAAFGRRFRPAVFRNACRAAVQHCLRFRVVKRRRGGRLRVRRGGFFGVVGRTERPRYQRTIPLAPHDHAPVAVVARTRVSLNRHDIGAVVAKLLHNADVLRFGSVAGEIENHNVAGLQVGVLMPVSALFRRLHELVAGRRADGQTAGRVRLMEYPHHEHHAPRRLLSRETLTPNI